MTGNLKLHLKPNERIFINGGVLKVDRKVAIEFLNDVVFLMEGHIIQEEEATTPLKQLYFVVQSMLMDPKTRDLARQIYEQSHKMLIATFKDQDVLEGLVAVKQMIERDRAFDALKKIRALFPIEAEILGLNDLAAPTKAVA
jgi:flagellar biosynthesis repressor protein FlbT